MLAIALPNVYAATFNCTIRTSCFANNETLLMRLNSSEAGAAPNNSHAQLANFSGGAYQYSVCCWTDSFRTMNNSCINGAKVLNLNATSDSHVQAATQSGYINYACLNVTSGNITCEYPTTACTGSNSPVVSIASSDSADNNLTNSHVADFGLYKQKVCCQIGGQNPPVVAYVNISPNVGATTRNDLECQNGSTTDADGDAVTLHYNWYKNGTSITLLNLPMDFNGTHTHDISGYANHGTVSSSMIFLPTGANNGGGAFMTTDGTSKITSPAINVNNTNFSVSTWMKNSISNSTDIFSFFGSSANNGWRAGVYQAHPMLYMSNTSGDIFLYCTGANINDSNWHNLVFVIYRGSNVTCYVDGQYYDVKTLGGGTFDNMIPSSIITGVFSSSYAFNGTLGEMIVFNRTISASEVKTLYNNNNRWMNGTELRRGDQWNCSITPVDSTGLNGSTKYSNLTNISGSPPLNVTLLYPANNNQSVFERFVNFTWTAADERDGDQVNYSLNLNASGSCAIQTQQTNLQSVNYTFGELCVDSYYNWTVQACDIDGCSAWATLYNFTVASVTSIRLVNNNTNFGALSIGQTIDTSNLVVMPFWIENDGNVFVNVTVIGNNTPSSTLFSSVGLNNVAFQYKARLNETGAFNTTNSPMTYTPVNASYTVAFNRLNYSDASDAAFIDINITVPLSEPPGTKIANVTFLATS